MYDTNVFRQVDIEPVPIEPTTEDSAAGIQPVRAVVRVVEYPVWRLRYGVQFNDERDDFVDPTMATSAACRASACCRPAEPELVRPRDHRRHRRPLRAQSAGRQPVHVEQLVLRPADPVERIHLRVTAAVRRPKTVSTIEERVGRDRRAALAAVPDVGSDLELPGRAVPRVRSRTCRPARSSSCPSTCRASTPRWCSIGATIRPIRREGWFASANWEQAVDALGSDYGNGKLLAQQSLYRKTRRASSLAGRAQVGTGFGDEALHRLGALPARWRDDGARLRREQLGPRDIFGQPAGGDALLAFNGEVRFPVRGWVQGVGFVDAGNVFRTRDDFSFRDSRWATASGCGWRRRSRCCAWTSAFRPGRSPPIARANQFKSGRVYFGIGHIF